MNGRRNPSVPLNGRKLADHQRDEDLLLFRELLKREKDRIATLLQPVSEEFEPNGLGNSALYRIPSGKKGSGGGYEFFPENNKNDYDWLKTPPATPLFPSLEMEANGAQLVIQRELPIIQPLSRFAGNKEPSKGRPKSPNPKPKITSRSITPSHRPSIPSTEALKNTKVATAPTSNNHKTSQPTISDPLNRKTTNVGRSTTTSKPQNQVDFLTSNLSRNLGTSANKTKPRSRGVSPLARSTIPVQFPGFSNETPPNLKTDRSTSATRGRPQPTGAPTTTHHVVVHQKAPEPSPIKTRRQSVSPSVTRGRRVEPKKETKGTQILGSRMVEKVMNARKSSSSVEERDAKQKLRGSTYNIGRTKHIYGDSK
ncbi:hypothetical protein PTKIN_Ptkin09bG0084200 [Pterospermum kingtungense]